MISEGELRRVAATLGADPMTVDLDYALGCFLSQWYRAPAAAGYRLKGGTCLRKCYFPDYRFSEDLDFTAEAPFTVSEIERLVRDAIRGAQETFGIDFGAQPPWFGPFEKGERGTSCEIRLYYRGPLRRTGSPRAIRLDVSHGEYLALPAARKRLHHPYSDASMLQRATIPCYALEEILGEKVRALCGQRRFAISRDLYDIYQLTVRRQVELERIRPFVADKFAAKGLVLGESSLRDFEGRRRRFERDWERNLRPLLPASDGTSLEEAWQAGVRVVTWASSLRRGG